MFSSVAEVHQASWHFRAVLRSGATLDTTRRLATRESGSEHSFRGALLAASVMAWMMDGCARSCQPGESTAGSDSGAPASTSESPPPLHITPLATTTMRLQQVALDREDSTATRVTPTSMSRSMTRSVPGKWMVTPTAWTPLRDQRLHQCARRSGARPTSAAASSH